jgi:hypothetical protein
MANSISLETRRQGWGPRASKLTWGDMAMTTILEEQGEATYVHIANPVSTGLPESLEQHLKKKKSFVTMYC